LIYAGELVVCGHCGHPITGKRKTKPTKSGAKHYVYYRCSRYISEGQGRESRVAVPLADNPAALPFKNERREIDGSDELVSCFGRIIGVWCKEIVEA